MDLNSIKSNALYDMKHGKPSPLERDNDGSCIVRLNIAPKMGYPKGEEPNETDKKTKKKQIQVGWSCYEVRTFTEPTKANLKKAIIRSLVDESAEFDLVNSYNKHNFGIKVDEEAVQRYKDYLVLTEEIDTALIEVLTQK